MILSLDLSLTATGWAKFASDGKLVGKGRIVPESELETEFKIQYICAEIETLIHNVTDLVIEDIFLHNSHPNVQALIKLARLSGAVIYLWMKAKFKIPYRYTASKARSIVGINARSQKAEIQCDISEIFHFIDKKDIELYRTKIRSIYNDFSRETITKGQFKYKMGKLSESIDKNSGISEDIADAILVGYAHVTKHKRKLF